MRRLLFVLLASALAASAAGTEDAIKGAEKGWAAAVTAKDFAALGKILDRNLIYAHSTGVIETKDEYLKVKATLNGTAQPVRPTRP